MTGRPDFTDRKVVELRRVEPRRQLFMAGLAVLAGCAGGVEPRSPLEGAGGRLLGPDTLLLTVHVGDYTPPGSLKPTLLQRANQIAREKRFAAFDIESTSMRHVDGSSGYVAQFMVRFLREVPPAKHGSQYVVDSDEVRLYRGEQPAHLLTSLASISNLRRFDEATGRIERAAPVLVDAVAAHKSWWSGESKVWLNPGRQHVDVYVWFRPDWRARPVYGLAYMEAELHAGRHYGVAVRFEKGVAEAWLVDAETGNPAGPPQRVIARP